MNISAISIKPKSLEISVLIAALVAANFILLFGRVCEPLIFFPAQVSAGEWWRIVTFPLVHVSWYHLVMDAGAFLILYHSLQEKHFWKRLLYVAACTAGSLGVSLISSPLDGGLCGLSGIAHGLMAISALEFINSTDRTLRNAGIICFLAVTLKSIYEAVTGHVIFETLHFGAVDVPVSICHAGGVLGGLCAFGLFSRKPDCNKK